MSNHIQPCSVANYLSSVVNRLQPFFPSVRANRDSDLVRCTLRGSVRHFTRPGMRKLPLSHDDLVHAYSSLTHPLTYDDLLWLTQLFCGFFALLRLNDLVWADAVHLHQNGLFVSQLSVELTEAHFTFTLPAQKMDAWSEGDRVLIQHLHSSFN